MDKRLDFSDNCGIGCSHSVSIVDFDSCYDYLAIGIALMLHC